MRIKTKWIKSPQFVILIVMIIIGIFGNVFISYDLKFYSKPVAKVTSVKQISISKTDDEFHNQDEQISQRLIVTVLNGKYRHHRLTLNNTYTKSQTNSHKYRKSNVLILNNISDDKGKLSASILSLKRDRILFNITWLIITILVVMMGRAGLLAFIGVFINLLLFIVMININDQLHGNAILPVSIISAVIFTAISLLLIQGFSKKMLATFGATIGGTLLSILIGLLLLNLTHNRGVYYETMSYITQFPIPLFAAETLLSSLGAVMDEASDIMATLFELKTVDPTVSRHQLFSSGLSVGHSIMGPLINVLFLIFLADTFNSSLLYLRNGNSWGFTFNMTMSLGMVQSLICGIGIVLTIPLTSIFGALLLGKQVKL